MKDKTRILNLVMVGVVAIFCCVAVTLLITIQQANDPVMRHVLIQQAQMLNLQKKMDSALSQRNRAAKGLAKQPGRVVQDAGRQRGLEQRMVALEKKIDGLVLSLKNLPKGSPQRQGPPPEEYTKVHRIDVVHSPVRGNKNAPITLVEFVDFQCPFCAKFHPVLDEVLAAYPKKVNYVLKNFPLVFHKQAKAAAKAAFAAGEQGKYWEMAELLLKNNKELTEEKFQEFAKDIGLNVKKFTQDYKNKDKEWERRILADMQLGQKVQVRGTPTFYINGRKTRSRDLAGFKREIDKLLKKKGK